MSCAPAFNYTREFTSPLRKIKENLSLGSWKVTGTVYSADSAISLEASDRQKYVDYIQTEKLQEQTEGTGNRSCVETVVIGSLERGRSYWRPYQWEMSMECDNRWIRFLCEGWKVQSHLEGHSKFVRNVRKNFTYMVWEPPKNPSCSRNHSYRWGQKTWQVPEIDGRSSLKTSGHWALQVAHNPCLQRRRKWVGGEK